jgi:selenocysteine-specific translation elongation factor
LAKICKETKAKISKYVAAYPELFITSSEDGTGIEALRAHLSGFALPKADRAAPKAGKRDLTPKTELNCAKLLRSWPDCR